MDNNNSNLFETSWDKKEGEEYEKCTFETFTNKHINSNLNFNTPSMKDYIIIIKYIKQKKTIK